MGRLWAMLFASVGLTLSESADAQEVHISGPLYGSCILRLDGYCEPARVEWSPWITSGVSIQAPDHRAGRVGPMVGIGVELTASVARYVGFPAAPSYNHNGAEREDAWHSTTYGELRLGGWAQAETRRGGGLIEGGFTAHLGTVADPLATLVFAEPYGVFDVRVGGGFGDFGNERLGHVAVAFAWGYRLAPGRLTLGEACDPEPIPAPIGDAILGRLVTTVRRTVERGAWEAVVAIEVSPTWATLIWRRPHHRSSGRGAR